MHFHTMYIYVSFLVIFCAMTPEEFLLEDHIVLWLRKFRDTLKKIGEVLFDDNCVWLKSNIKRQSDIECRLTAYQMNILYVHPYTFMFTTLLYYNFTEYSAHTLLNVNDP